MKSWYNLVPPAPPPPPAYMRRECNLYDHNITLSLSYYLTYCIRQEVIFKPFYIEYDLYDHKIALSLSCFKGERTELSGYSTGSHGGLEGVPGVLHHPRPLLHLHLQVHRLQDPLAGGGGGGLHQRHPPHPLLLLRLVELPGVHHGHPPPRCRPPLPPRHRVPAPRHQPPPQARPHDDLRHDPEQTTEGTPA